MATNKGTVKKINLKDLESVRKNGMIAINLDDDEDLIGVELTDGNSEITVTSLLSLGRTVATPSSDSFPFPASEQAASRATAMHSRYR